MRFRQQYDKIHAKDLKDTKVNIQQNTLTRWETQMRNTAAEINKKVTFAKAK